MYIYGLKSFWTEQFTDSQITRGNDTKQQQKTGAERIRSRFASFITLYSVYLQYLLPIFDFVTMFVDNKTRDKNYYH